MNTLLSAVETQFAARLESEARLRQFLADASHELRTPLTSIRGYAELARMQRAAGEMHDDNLSRIESEGTRMSRLVEDLLMLARGDRSGEPVNELIDVAELVDDAVAGTRAAFPERQIDVESAPGLHAVGDRDQLLRAVRNLMTNAAVHTAPERPIRATSALQDDSVVIQVIDGGPGLPPGRGGARLRAFLARRQGTQPAARRIGSGHVDRGLDRRRQRRDGVLRQLGRARQHGHDRTARGHELRPFGTIEGCRSTQPSPRASSATPPD